MPKGVNEPVADEVLLQRARAGDPAAIVEFATRWWSILARVAWSMLGNTSQAIGATEEVLGIVLHAPQPPAAPVRLAMYRLVIWLAIIRRRSNRGAAAARTPVFDALAHLHSADRAAFVLCDVEHLPVADAAAVLEISPAEVRAGTHRARMQLTRLLGDEASAADLEIEPMGRLSA